MATTHRLLRSDARDLAGLKAASIHCIVTSPPYPMIGMWDPCFGELRPEIAHALKVEDGEQAFELMHQELDRVWREAFRVLVDGGIACINIGDATRKIGGSFRLFVNHARILQCCTGLGFQALPAIIWRKQTNAPTKFMGSGMLPPGAYVTLEHEYILILRKGAKREFRTNEAKAKRSESAFFWEERNQWFSDVWYDLKGTSQNLADTEARSRSGAYPFELAYRLVNMFSIKGDTILDPFVGTGTTTLAAMASERNSVGIDIDADLLRIAGDRAGPCKTFLNDFIAERVQRHLDFVENRLASGKDLKKGNEPHGFPCISAQERKLKITPVLEIQRVSDHAFSVKNDTEPIECCVPGSYPTVQSCS